MTNVDNENRVVFQTSSVTLKKKNRNLPEAFINQVGNSNVQHSDFLMFE